MATLVFFNRKAHKEGIADFALCILCVLCLRSLRLIKSGGLAGTRTLDQCLKRALLYQLSYQPTPTALLKRRTAGECTDQNAPRNLINNAPTRKSFPDAVRRWRISIFETSL